MIDFVTVIGRPPEHRDHRMSTPGHYPEIHPTAIVEAFCTVDAGVERPTRVEEGAWLMKGVHVGHDAVIGANAELAPHCSVGGHAEIGPNVRVGQGALFKPYVKVGEGARIGMGAVVVKDVPSGETWVGNPARRLGG